MWIKPEETDHGHLLANRTGEGPMSLASRRFDARSDVGCPLARSDACTRLLFEGLPARLQPNAQSCSAQTLRVRSPRTQTMLDDPVLADGTEVGNGMPCADERHHGDNDRDQSRERRSYPKHLAVSMKGERSPPAASRSLHEPPFGSEVCLRCEWMGSFAMCHATVVSV